MSEMNEFAERILTLDPSRVVNAVGEILADPAANRTGAIALFAIATLLVLITFAVVLLFVMGGKPDDEEAADDAHEGAVAGDTEPVAEVVPVVAPLPLTPRQRLVRRAVSAVVFAGILAVTWLALGVATSQEGMCQSCHAGDPHDALARPVQADRTAHKSVTCVDCHEDGSLTGPYGFATAGRALHFARGFELTKIDEYGTITSRSCTKCHERVESVTVTSKSLGVKMSHKEPIAAGASCIDCHTPEQGIASGSIGGMTRCLPCHNGKDAFATCEECHVRDVSVASSGRTTPAVSKPRQLVPRPDCGGCHDQARSCDPCHGTRMPHTAGFMTGGHARPAVQTYWSGDGTMCFKCHTDERRSCGQCHSGRFWSHGKGWARNHQSDVWDGRGCDNCHYATRGVLVGRNFCANCHEVPEPSTKDQTATGQSQ